MGYTAKTGPAGRAISALKQYGLLDERDGQYRISDAAYSILQLSENSVERKAALKEAAQRPALFKDLIENHKDGLPSDLNLRDYLIRSKKFNPDSVADFITILRETVSLAFDDEGADNGNADADERIRDLPPMDEGLKQRDGQPGVEAPYFRVHP